MSRTLSKLFVKINFTVYAVNFAVLFIAMIMLFSATGNMMIFMIPGIFLCGIICLVYPDFFNMVAGLLHLGEVTSPTPTTAFEHIGQIISDAFNRDYSFLKQNGFPLATFCVVICWIIGIVCLFQQPGLNKVVHSPMDWFKRKSFSTYAYAVFGGIYAVLMCIGAGAVAFAKEAVKGGLLTLAWYFLICGIVVLFGIIFLIFERLWSVQTFNAMTVEEQNAVCEKQSKYMNKHQRKRQVRRLGDDARFVEEDKKISKRQAKREAKRQAKLQAKRQAETEDEMPTDDATDEGDIS